MVLETITLVGKVCNFISPSSESNNSKLIDKKKRKEELIKKEIKARNEYVNKLLTTNDNVTNEIDKLKLQIKKLAEENYRLKKMIIKVNTRVDNANVAINDYIESVKKDVEEYL